MHPIQPSTPLYSEVWTIDETQKREWQDFLAEQRISEDYLRDVFATGGAAIIQFGKIAPNQKCPEMAAPTLQNPRLLWSNDRVEVYMPSRPRVRHHLWVVLSRPVSSFSEVTSDEAVELQATVKKIQYFLRTVFETLTFVVKWNHPQPGQLPGRFTIEVIPTRPESRTVFDALDKVECNEYILWRDRFPASLPSSERDEIEQDEHDWSINLSEPSPPFSNSQTGEPFEEWSIVKTRIAEKNKKLLDSIYRLISPTINMKREETTQEIPNEPGVILGKKSCPFCTQKILDSEKIFETPLSYLLYNYKPATHNGHFLLFPKRHVRSSENLREDEIRDLHQLTLRLIKVLEEKEQRFDLVEFTQDGPPVAQSVPHTHKHLLLTPEILRFMVFSLNYTGEKTLTQEEMRPIIDDIGERLRNE